MSIHTNKISLRFSTLALGLAMAAAARAEVLVTVEPAAPVVTVRDMACKFVVESFHDLGARGSCRHLQWFPLATRGVLPYAGGPAGLWADPAGGDLLVAASGCIVRISQYPGPPWRLAHRWAMVPDPGTPAQPGETFILNQVVLAEQPLAAAGLACQARFAYRLDLLDPDGNPDCAPLTGQGSLDVALPPCRIRLSRPGTWTMVLTAVTETGHNLDWRWSWTLPAPVAADAGRPPVSAAGPA